MIIIYIRIYRYLKYCLFWYMQTTVLIIVNTKKIKLSLREFQPELYYKMSKIYLIFPIDV